MAVEDEQTDTFPRPSPSGPRGAVPVKLASGDAAHDGTCISVSGDQIAILLSATLAVDAQVEVRSQGEPALESVGVVVWSRSDADQTAVGVEIIGGADDWRALLAEG